MSKTWYPILLSRSQLDPMDHMPLQTQDEQQVRNRIHEQLKLSSIHTLEKSKTVFPMLHTHTPTPTYIINLPAGEIRTKHRATKATNFNTWKSQLCCCLRSSYSIALSLRNHKLQYGTMHCMCKCVLKQEVEDDTSRSSSCEVLVVSSSLETICLHLSYRSASSFSVSPFFRAKLKPNHPLQVGTYTSLFYMINGRAVVKLIYLFRFKMPFCVLS